MRRFVELTLIASLAALGCDKGESTSKTIAPPTTDLGTGLNTVERTYGTPAPALVDIVAAALKSFDLKLESDRHDDLGGELTALRADGHKVTAKLTSVDATHTRVAIRVAPGNRELAELIHQRIAEKLLPRSTP